MRFLRAGSAEISISRGRESASVACLKFLREGGIQGRRWNRPPAKTRRRFHGGARGPHEKSYTELSLKFQPGPFISWLRGLLSLGVRAVCIAANRPGEIAGERERERGRERPDQRAEKRYVVGTVGRGRCPADNDLSRGILSNIITSPL